MIAFGSSVFALWCTVLAFKGGTVPITGWVLKGTVNQGVVWLVFVTPLITTVGYWVAMLITLPLAAIFRPKR